MREGRLEDIGVLAYCLLYINLDESSLFRQLWVFRSLLSNFFIDDFTARQYKNCVRILKGSYIVTKCSDNKV